MCQALCLILGDAEIKRLRETGQRGQQYSLGRLAMTIKCDNMPGTW